MAEIITMSAAGMLLIVALWCALSPKYDDGIIGHLLFGGMALSSYAILISYPVEPSPIASSALVICTISAALRELFLRAVWPYFKNHKGH